jgi:hypothetical protein
MECLLMRRLARLFYSLLTAATFQLTACGADEPPDEPIHFAQTTDLQRQRAVAAGVGGDELMGYLIGTVTTSVPPEQSSCPTITRSGDTITATGGCTDPSGDRIEGRIIAKNVRGFVGGSNDPSKPEVMTFEDFHLDGDGPSDDFIFDGTITIDIDGSMTADLHTTMAGIEVWSDATWTSSSNRTTARDGSTIELEGLGRAAIEGSWNMSSDAPAGTLELRGADVLRANFGATANECVPITVDGAPAGQFCSMNEAAGDM